MSTYIIGDIHGCYNELKVALDRVKFDSKKDQVWLTGDLVSRGEKSLEVLRFIKNLGNSARIVLGNHDLNLIAIYLGIKKNHSKYKLSSILEAFDAKELINWLRIQPILQIDEEKKLLMIHAGILPNWNIKKIKRYAKEIEKILQGNDFYFFLKNMYENEKEFLNFQRKKIDRFCFLVNVFTRIRYCFPNKKLELNCKIRPNKVQNAIKPWFSFKTVLKKYNIIFGHWSTLNGWKTPENIYGLDTGCCWGRYLTLLSWDKREFIRISSKYKNS